MKKFLSLILAILMLTLVFASCNADDDESKEEPASVEKEPDNRTDEEKYDAACELIENNKLQEAYNLLIEIKNYEPAKEQLKNFAYAPQSIVEKWERTDVKGSNSISYKYDDMGNITERVNGDESDFFTYNADGNILSGVDLVWSSDFSTYTYQNGRLYQQIGTETVKTYYYNSKGELEKTSSKAYNSDNVYETFYEYTYYDNGEIKSIVEDNDWELYEYIYDESGKLLKVNVYYMDGGVKVICGTYDIAYGDFGVSSITMQYGGAGALATYKYSSDGKPTSAEIKTYNNGKLYGTYTLSFSKHKLVYSENPNVHERLSHICTASWETICDILM